MENLNPTLLFVVSIGLFGGIIGGWLFQAIRIPQVVGYIVIGLIVGESGFGIIQAEHVSNLRSFSFFALGIIGFLVGGELKLGTFRKYGRQFTAILFGEGILAFILVTIAATLLIYRVYPHLSLALAAGLVLGSIASATDPASTVDVLWEYRSQGLLTTSIIAIVALDDGLAMALYGLGTGLSRILAGGSADIGRQLLQVGIHLGGAILMGGAAACLLALLIRFIPHVDRSVALAVGLIMLVISVAIYADVDVILAAMTMGFVLTNLAPMRSKRLFELLRSFSIPIYVMFFVLVGARLHFKSIPGWIWLIALAYVLCRSIGKMLGAYLGGRFARAPFQVRKYLGSSLFAQGGVAIGLSIMASQNLSTVMITEDLSLGAVVIAVVTITTMIVQLLGPAAVKFCIKAAGEAGRDVTEEDVLKQHPVTDAVIPTAAQVPESAPVSTCIQLLRDCDQFILPVVDQDKHYRGLITLEALKSVLADPDQWNWLIAADVANVDHAICRQDMTMHEAFTLLNKAGREQLIVVDDEGRLRGIFDRNRARHLVKREMGANPSETASADISAEAATT